MPQADSEEWFRESDFRADVRSYLRRQRIPIERVALFTDVTGPTIRNFLKGGTLSIRLASALACYCDLSLDSYCLNQSQHDQLIERKLNSRMPLKRVSQQQINVINNNLPNLPGSSDGPQSTGSDTQPNLNVGTAARRLAPRAGFTSASSSSTATDHQASDH